MRRDHPDYLKVRNLRLQLERYELLEQQVPERCEICGKKETVTRSGAARRLCFDHDHDTGQLRGFLCSRCNTGISLFGDDPVLMRKAADYLTFNQAYIELDGL